MTVVVVIVMVMVRIVVSSLTLIVAGRASTMIVSLSLVLGRCHRATSEISRAYSVYFLNS
jgi:hypothetical protein